MKAIITKYHPAGNVRGARISAKAEGVKGVSIPYPIEKERIDQLMFVQDTSDINYLKQVYLMAHPRATFSE